MIRANDELQTKGPWNYLYEVAACPACFERVALKNFFINSAPKARANEAACVMTYPQGACWLLGDCS